MSEGCVSEAKNSRLHLTFFRTSLLQLIVLQQKKRKQAAVLAAPLPFSLSLHQAVDLILNYAAGALALSKDARPAATTSS